MDTEAEFEHGTRRGYRTFRCRCDECRAWNAACSRKYDKRRNEKFMPLAERVAEVEWLAGTDTLENIAFRLGWPSREHMLDHLKYKGYPELADRLVRNETFGRHGKVARILGP